MGKYILGIESSCDDTSVALLRVEGKEFVDCINRSSQALQNNYGGVVPEIAARCHEENILLMVIELFEKNKVSFEDIQYVAYTDHPGLANCLFVGIVFAKTIAKLFNIQAIPINHVYGHLFSHGLTRSVVFPFIGLVVSGKTTAIYHVRGPENIVLIEETGDNALGEAYDKLARCMGLPYPGGRYIDELFDEKLKTEKLLDRGLPVKRVFSYSGIITASKKKWLAVKGNNDIKDPYSYMATCFQRYVIDNLTIKIKYWSEQKDSMNISVSGGVAANSYFRNKLASLQLSVMLVDKRFAGDNAAMIAYYALWKILKT